MIGKLIIAAYIAASFRTANVPGNPNDYEYSAGIDGKHDVYISGSKERENGIKYDNFAARRSATYTHIDILYREAQQIDRQSFGVKYPIQDFAIGATVNTLAWDKPQLMEFMQYRTDILSIIYEVGEDRQYISSEVSKKLPLKGKFYLKPEMRFYKQYIGKTNTEFWSTKLILGYEL